jgi:SAM-dependent methyltransferase
MTIWNERYNSDDFLFGREPNQFFKEMIDKLEPGKLLLPGEGEGRNAVYAAKLGWDVYAFDASTVGQGKALMLAQNEDVSINYDISLIEHFEPEPEKYDVIALIFCHLQQEIRHPFFDKLAESLAPGGTLFMEAFRKEQLAFSSGGPRDPEMLYSVEHLAVEFSTLPDLEIYNETEYLDEGPGHQGEAKVVRLVGKKH